jgi:hypothetical protein
MPDNFIQMPISANPPELIIALSHDKVRVQVLPKSESGRPHWQSNFPIQGIFLEERISLAMDAAMLENESLMDSFDGVEILVVDSPSVCIPTHEINSGKLEEIAGRYLRLRSGETLTADIPSGTSGFAYSLPVETLAVLREYYAGAGCLHLASVLWCALNAHEEIITEHPSRLFYIVLGNTMLIFGQTKGKLSFSKSFYVEHQSDIAYYMVACSQMLSPMENWHITLEGETNEPAFPSIPDFQIHHHLQLPSLPNLIAWYRQCES